jgi:hypothetical protein
MAQGFWPLARLGAGQTLDEVGQTFGYARQGIHRIESSALAELMRKHARFLQLAGPGVNRKVDTQPEPMPAACGMSGKVALAA